MTTRTVSASVLALSLGIGLLSACSGDKPTTPGAQGTPAAAGGTATAKPTAAGSNQPPMIREVTLTCAAGVDFDHPNRSDVIEARAVTSDPENDGVMVTWSWTVNGREIPSALGDRLTPDQGGYKKGDTVTAVASARDTRGAVQSALSRANIVVRNTPPTITSNPATLTNYQVAATDPDGDTLRFYLEKPVPGFVINSDGHLSFDSAAGKAANGQVLVIVAHDPDGATSKQSITINF